MTTMHFGSPNGLEISLDFAGPPQGALAADRSRGSVGLWIRAERVWPSEDTDAAALEWTWVGFIQHLAASWPWLRFEQTPALHLQTSLMGLEAAAAERWLGGENVEDEDAEEEELLSFLAAHDLAEAVGGMRPPSLRLLRVGARMRVGYGAGEVHLPLTDVLATLGAFGDAIVERLRGSAHPSCQVACAQWEARNRVAPLDAARIVVGAGQQSSLLVDRAAKVVDLRTLRQVEDSPVLAVARMSSVVGDPAVLEAVAAAIDACAEGHFTALDQLAARARHGPRATRGEKPWQQGRRAAQAVRAALDLDKWQPVDTEQVLADLGVQIVEASLVSAAIDAIACWSPGHGPAVIINQDSIAMQEQFARRAAFAHELCHLLVDRLGALPLAEVLDGRIHRPVEQRARMFAAEFLVPQAAAAEAFRMVTTQAAANKELLRLAKIFGASYQVVAWQVRNALRGQLHPVARAFLRRHVDRPAVY